MNWKECVALAEFYLPQARLNWPNYSDFDCQEATTISDVWGGIAWIWTYPGDVLLYGLSDLPDVRVFFEMTGGPYIGTTFSAILPFALLFFLIGR